jgi:hypothetical protein
LVNISLGKKIFGVIATNHTHPHPVGVINHVVTTPVTTDRATPSRLHREQFRGNTLCGGGRRAKYGTKVASHEVPPVKAVVAAFTGRVPALHPGLVHFS